MTSKSLLVLCTLIVWMAFPIPVAATTYPARYGGYATNQTWNGIDGYIRQSTTTPVGADQYHFDWLELCGPSLDGACHTWVQQGSYQSGNESPAVVSLYHEFVDPCYYHRLYLTGTVSPVNYAFYLTWNGLPSHSGYCQSGEQVTLYTFEYRKGSWASSPYFTADLGGPAGRVAAAVEVQMPAGQSINMGTDYFGCSGPGSCTNPGYGIHLYQTPPQNWTLWAQGLGGSPMQSPGGPYPHNYVDFDAFRVCRDPC